MGQQGLMKDGIDRPAVMRIQAAFVQLVPAFPAERFEQRALCGLHALALKERVNHLIEVLSECLPKNFSELSAVLEKLPEIWDKGDPDDALRGFAMWPIIDFVAVYGIEEPERSLHLLVRLTPLFSAEFAIRPFIERYEALSLRFLEGCLTHPDEHVRRLVSEGTRPRLPWGLQLKRYIEDPSPVMPFLSALRLDESDYVRRSVANNLNDIAKDHPQLVVDYCRQWQAQDAGASDWVIRHATRSLVKDGFAGVFSLLGYTAAPAVDVVSIDVDTPRVNMGQAIAFDISLCGRADSQYFVLDYAVYYRKANGKVSPKVFKLKDVLLNSREVITFNKTISFKPITTRKYYTGKHFIAVHINGEEVARCAFELTD